MASENPNPFGFGCTASNPFSFSNINSKETLTDSEERRRTERHEKMVEIMRIRSDLGSMWPVISAYTELSSKDDEADKVVAAAKKAVDAANKATAAANEAAAAANEAANMVAAYGAATLTTPWLEQPKPGTKGPLDYLTELYGACVEEDPAVIELDNKILSDKARKALEHYKETKGEEYEFVENERFETTILAPFYADHITFTAKPKEKGDSCPKLFFAEVYQRFEHDDYEVKMCMILDSCGPDVMMGCDYVDGDKDMLHPSGVKFWAGPPSGTSE